MKLSRPVLLVWALFAVLCSQSLCGQEAETSTVAEHLKKELLLPGVSLAEGVSEITGVAISPLLGVSAVGAWKYWQADAEMRARLPWYCHPWIWGSGLTLLGICFLKDFLGAAAPALVKKPLDFLELFEDKLSALVASVGFVPLVALAMSQFEQIEPSQAMQSGVGISLAAIPTENLGHLLLHNPWLTVPLSLIAFGAVWLSSHAINVLIALSPFGIVDAGLKLTKLALVSLIAGSAALIPLSPWPSLIICGIFILIGALAAGWSFRLTLFGTLMGRDLLLNKKASSQDVRDAGIRGFLARQLQGAPVRTYGKLTTDSDGSIHFTYWPWLILPSQKLPISETDLVVCKGLLHPSVAHRESREARPRSTLILLPRYRTIEDSIACHFGCQEVIDSTLMRGFKAMRQWLVDFLSLGRNVIAAATK